MALVPELGYQATESGLRTGNIPSFLVHQSVGSESFKGTGFSLSII